MARVEEESRLPPEAYLTPRMLQQRMPPTQPLVRARQPPDIRIALLLPRRNLGREPQLWHRVHIRQHLRMQPVRHALQCAHDPCVMQTRRLACHNHVPGGLD